MKLLAALRACVRLLRPNRSVMVAAVTGTGAMIVSGDGRRSLLAALVGWLLAVGGFSLDFHADRAVDAAGPRALVRRNPLADGTLPPAAGLAFSLVFLTAGLTGIGLLSAAALVPASLIAAIVAGLALHWLEGAVARALTLGALQALYLLLGAVLAGGLQGASRPAVLILALMFFFAMAGGRGMIDIRDFPVDEPGPVRTLPKRLGVRTTAVFTAVCLHAAFALSLAAYWTGQFSVLYFYLALPYTAVGLFCAWWFALRPSPQLARRLTLVFMMGEGALICLAAILGRL